jgi:hypothetical protein
VSKIEDVHKEEEEPMSFMVKHYYDEPEDEWILDSGATGAVIYAP